MKNYLLIITCLLAFSCKKERLIQFETTDPIKDLTYDKNLTLIE